MNIDHPVATTAHPSLTNMSPTITSAGNNFRLFPTKPDTTVPLH